MTGGHLTTAVVETSCCTTSSTTCTAPKVPLAAFAGDSADWVEDVRLSDRGGAAIGCVLPVLAVVLGAVLAIILRKRGGEDRALYFKVDRSAVPSRIN